MADFRILVEPLMGIEPMNPFITSKVLYQLSYSGNIAAEKIIKDSN